MLVAWLSLLCAETVSAWWVDRVLRLRDSLRSEDSASWRRRQRAWERVERDSWMREMAVRSGWMLKFVVVWWIRVAGSSSRSIVGVVSFLLSWYWESVEGMDSFSQVSICCVCIALDGRMSWWV